MPTRRENDRIQDMRRRIAALHGTDVAPKEFVRRTMGQLERELSKRYKERRARRAETDKYFRKIRAPLADILAKDRRAMEGIRGLREMTARLKRRKKLAAPKVQKMEPRIMSGSILTLATPPYRHVWTAGGGHASEEANSGGTFGFGLVGDGSSWAAAGVGVSFQPVADNVQLRFAPLVSYSYSWRDVSNLETAHSDASMNYRVWEADSNWQNPHIKLDLGVSLWSDGTGWEEDHSDSGDAWFGTQAFVSNLSSSNRYLFWVWCSGSADDATFAFWWSIALADLSVTVPFMVFEQFT